MKKLATLFLGAVLVLGACSSGSTTTSKQSDASATTSDRSSNAAAGSAQLEVVARAFVTAFINRDADSAHPLFTARCRKAVSTKNLATFIENSVKDSAGAKISKISTNITGDTALVDYIMSEPALTRREQRWKIENGTWHNDDC